ncbi:MAG: single-stranded-DNA-specific exonuclease RecJ [Phycisphaerales bacterium]
MSSLYADQKRAEPVRVEPAETSLVERGLKTVWKARSTPPEGLNLLSRVLAARGLGAEADADAFMNPSLRGLHDPSLIPDLDRAAERLLQAIHENQQIVIFGDYDVDGVTASAILIHTIRAIAPGADVRSYIPHRVEEGYGLNSDALKMLREQGAELVITVDCGITASEPAVYARDIGLDLIITDHHNPPDSLADLPDAFAVVHPRRPDTQYPFGELCGAGVAYKLAWRLCVLHCGSERVQPALRETLVEMLGFAALGSIADVVPLIDENRVIVKHGLRQVPHSRIEGLMALIRASSLDSDKIDTEDVGFRLAPRLNAIGRLGHAREALHLMTDARGAEAEQLASRLSRVNDERKSIGEAIFAQAVEMATELGMTSSDRRAIVLAHEDWHPGVVGIVCSRLVERFARPVILMQQDGDLCKGSGRSIDGFNLHAGLNACEPHLAGFGGHDMAAGMRCEAVHFESFADAFIAHANDVLRAEDLVNTSSYDVEATVAELSVACVETLERLAPFGAGNPRVRIKLRDAKLVGDPSPFGRAGNHLSLRVSDRRSPGHALRVVAWNWAGEREKVPPGAPVELIVEPKVSRWNGRSTVEPVLVDLRVS